MNSSATRPPKVFRPAEPDGLLSPSMGDLLLAERAAARRGAFIRADAYRRVRARRLARAQRGAA